MDMLAQLIINRFCGNHKSDRKLNKCERFYFGLGGGDESGSFYWLRSFLVWHRLLVPYFLNLAHYPLPQNTSLKIYTKTK